MLISKNVTERVSEKVTSREAIASKNARKRKLLFYVRLPVPAPAQPNKKLNTALKLMVEQSFENKSCE